MIRKLIQVKVLFEGIHCWKDVIKDKDLKYVYFLQHPHRHIFHIICEKEVTHDDRDIEIISFKREIAEYLEFSYPNNNLGQTSCEMLCMILMNEFKLYSCQVLEDNENGAKYFEENKPSYDPMWKDTVWYDA